jgi:hypothetical protein
MRRTGLGNGWRVKRPNPTIELYTSESVARGFSGVL